MSEHEKWVALNSIDIKIEVWDFDRFNPDDRIGQFCMKLGDLSTSVPDTGLALEKPKRTFKNPGKLRVAQCDVHYL